MEIIYLLTMQNLAWLACRGQAKIIVRRIGLGKVRLLVVQIVDTGGPSETRGRKKLMSEITLGNPGQKSGRNLGTRRDVPQLICPLQVLNRFHALASRASVARAIRISEASLVHQSLTA
jgi:hypothetical protein